MQRACSVDDGNGEAHPERSAFGLGLCEGGLPVGCRLFRFLVTIPNTLVVTAPRPDETVAREPGLPVGTLSYVSMPQHAAKYRPMGRSMAIQLYVGRISCHCSITKSQHSVLGCAAHDMVAAGSHHGSGRLACTPVSASGSVMPPRPSMLACSVFMPAPKSTVTVGLAALLPCAAHSVAFNGESAAARTR